MSAARSSGEVAPRPDRAAETRVEALDRVGRADDPADPHVVVEERHEPLPRAYPQAADGGVFAGPPAERLVARRLGGPLADGGVDRCRIASDGACVLSNFCGPFRRFF